MEGRSILVEVSPAVSQIFVVGAVEAIDRDTVTFTDVTGESREVATTAIVGIR